MKMINRLKFKTVMNKYNLELKRSLVIIDGDSGTGKTLLFEALDDLKLDKEYKYLSLFNYKDIDDVEDMKKLTKRLIVIDNADCILEEGLRRHISADKQNQYLIFGRDTTYLAIGEYNAAHLIQNEDGIFCLDYYNI